MVDIPSDEVVYTLTPQPGIKRDGTLLEGEFCSDGEWVRFQRGKAKKTICFIRFGVVFMKGKIYYRLDF